MQGDPKMTRQLFGSEGRLNQLERVRSIQGLYDVKDSHESFWTLKAKIELAVFREHKKEVTQHEKT